MRALLKIRNVRLYLLGDAVSTLGDSALWLAMAIWMKELTGSSALAGLVMFCFAIGNLLSPLGGVVADRFRRRPLLIWSNVAAGALVLLVLLVHDRSEIWIVYLVMLGYGAAGSVMGPAQSALLPALVPAELLAEANGAQQTLNQGLRLVTPLVGAGLFALVGAAVVAEMDAATFVVAIVCLLAVRVSEPRARGLVAAAAAVAEGSQDSSTADQDARLTAGFAFIAREPTLRAITLALAFALLAFGFTESAAFSVVTQGLHHRATFVGFLNTVQGAGAIAGGLSAAAILRRVSEGVLTALGLACAGAAVLLLTLPNTGLVLTGMVLAGPVGPWVGVAAITALQRRTPAHLIGRVSGAFNLALTVPQVASVGLGSALIAVVNYRVLLVAVAVAASVSVAFLLSQRPARLRPADAAADLAASGGAEPAEVTL
jgi:Na+/melibiose symporter-like transporter